MLANTCASNKVPDLLDVHSPLTYQCANTVSKQCSAALEATHFFVAWRKLALAFVRRGITVPSRFDLLRSEVGTWLAVHKMTAT